MQMWIFLMLILSITTGTVLTLEQRSDKVDHKWDLTHRVPWTTPCPPWHYTAPQLHTPTNMLVLIIFSCMKRKKPHAKYVIWMFFFPPKTQPFTDFRQTFNSERNQEPGLELQDGCTRRFYQKDPLLLRRTSYTSTHLSEVTPSCSQAETRTSLVLTTVTFAFIWVCRRFKLKNESFEKKRRWLVVSGTLLLAENVKWKET